MILITIETLTFLLLMFLILHFKVLSRSQLGEREIGPFNIVYIRNIGTSWTIASKIRDLKKYLKTKGIKSDLYINIYLADPTKSSKAVPCIIGAIIDEKDLPLIEEPFETMTISPRYVATAASGNRIIGLNKNTLYPQLKAYMNVHGYINQSNEFIELYHMGENNNIGKGFFTEVCTRVRKQTDEELLETEKHENRGMNAANVLFGGKNRFGKE